MHFKSDTNGWSKRELTTSIILFMEHVIYSFNTVIININFMNFKWTCLEVLTAGESYTSFI